MIRRTAESLLKECLSDTPVVLIHGPRQAGKSTLAQEVGQAMGMKYINLDDSVPRSLATSDPTGFIETLTGPVILDEIQRVPQLFLPIKSSVDRNRTPGRFLLSGSANVLMLPKVADSLAGRMAIVDLLPFAQCEIEQNEQSQIIDRMFDEELIGSVPTIEGDLVERIIRGGFPEPSMRSSAARRDTWFNDYIRTLLERDVRDLANIDGLTQMPRLLSLLAARTGSTLNVVGLSRDTGIPNTSMHRYLDLLKAVFLIHHVPSWSNNEGAKLTKSAKVFLVDTGLLGYLTNATPKTFQREPEKFELALKNFVAMELKKLTTFSELRPVLHHLRTVKQLEVDFVLEARGGGVVGIDVRGSSTLRPEDADSLKFLEELAGDKFVRGVVLYTGKEVQPLARNILGLPMDALWTL